MGRHLEVPEAAVDALFSAGRGPAKENVRRIAAPVVAAELRRLAYRLQQRSDNTLMTRDGGGQERVATLRQTADELIARADELDPQ